jgi:hypothetical protein
MKHKVSELTGVLLDAAVAMAEGFEYFNPPEDREGWAPSRGWYTGGPIIAREHISLTSPDMMPRPGFDWRAEMLGTLLSREQGGRDRASATGSTALIAAMRAYVASKYGDEVDLP